jgi:hypothetical protein
MVNVKIILEYLTLPDNDFIKNPKHVAISHTETYHRT